MCDRKTMRSAVAKKMARNIATGNDRQAYRTVKKNYWGDGPWKTELDKAVWIDASTGLDCMHRRCADGGYLCGYVAVAPGHPLFGFDHDALPASLNITAHTGIVESGLCDYGNEAEVMCHEPAPGKPHDVWWFGFKCNDVGDDCPDQIAAGRLAGDDRAGVYRTTEYVREECRKLAMRLASVARANEAPLALASPAITFELARKVEA